ncbi:glycosyltransferase [Acidithiobacillus ferriphilus]|uniref:glycosyltransferase n=1 Tax=Acidithiobacillus ferriphilus TaxID=1689834 RepID=UPI002DB9D0B2|nr:glycosyltransferase [Acidithiobacillus ferriphilus]MEB8537197.1 glycosyltransferase [Acidithiobacillus ferriphilus]
MNSYSNTTQKAGIFDMPINRPSAASATLDELLSYHDERFIYNAYHTLLDRAPDAEGLSYYLASLRSGIGKVEILAQIRLSAEGKSREIKVAKLDEEIRRHKLLKIPFLGTFMRITGIIQVDDDEQKKLNAIENKLNLLETNLQAILFDIKNKLEWINKQIDQNNLVINKHSIQDDQPRTKKYFPEKITENRIDATWYLEQNPDLAGSEIDSYEHYMSYGKEEGGHPAFDSDWYLSQYHDVAENGMDALEHYLKFGKAEGRQPIDRSNYQNWIKEFDTLTDSIRYGMSVHAAHFEHHPLISVVMPVYNPNPNWLVEAIESVCKQIYQNWELCIADDASPDKAIHSILKQYAQKDKRIKVTFRKENGHISAASNSALALAQGEWIALLDHDDVLAEHALYWVVDAINHHRDSRMIYSDSDNILEQGVRASPFFKCDWNPDLFYSHNFFSHLGVYHAQLVRSIGGFRIGMEGSQDYDLALRCIEKINSSQIHHIPRILYHWRVHAESTAFSSDVKPYAMIAGEKAINEHFDRQGINAKVELIGYGYKVKYPLPDSLPLVSLIIPTRNGLSILRQCVESILAKTTYSNYEILIVDNGSDDPETLHYLQGLLLGKRIRVLRDDRPFNYSALNNAAVKMARGEVVGLINNDIEVISPDWLSEMVSHALRPEVGAVGARLWYPNDTLQHGGVILGIGGTAGHSHKGLRRDQYGYFNRACLVQNYSAITAACLVIKKDIYEKVLGFNEINLSVAYNDVDFCIRVREAGYRNVWTPYAELYHHESATRGYEDSPEKKSRSAKEMEYLMRQWGNLLLNDPFYSPNLTLDKEDFSFAWPPRISSYESLVIAYNTLDEVQQEITQNKSLNLEVEITRVNFDADGYLKSNPDVKKHGLDAYDHYINYGKKEGRIAFRKGFGFPQLLQIDDEEYDLLISKANAWPRKPLISIIMPTYNVSEIWLRQALDSVINQAYHQWELCIADDASTLPHVKHVLNEYARRDARIKVFFSNENGGVSAASNNALALATGDFTALLDHDDLLERHALYYLAESILEDYPDIIYSDELLVNEQADGVIYHEFRPMFSLELLRSHPYIVHLVAFRTTLLREIGGFDESLTISQDYDLILRAIELAKNIVHIPKALYRWRIHDSSSGHSQKDQVMATSKKILAAHLARCGENAEVSDGKYFNYFETRYTLESNLRVAIIIPTKNHGKLVRQCVDSINKTVLGVNYDIVIIDHDSDDGDSIGYFDEITSQHIVLKYSGEFNFSAINNWAIKQLNDKYSHYLLCNNDIEAIHSGWLERMLELGQKPDIGMVGTKLFYPDFTIQHAGVCVGMFVAAEHYGKFIENTLPDDRGINPGYIGSLIANHEMSAVTAACVLIRRDAFETVNGFDEKLKVGYGDVDLCLRVRQAGYRIVFCPHAELIHHESLSRGKSTTDQHPEDTRYFLNRWHSFIANGDPYYNPNLSLNNTTWSLKNPSLFPLSENMNKRRIFIKLISNF